MAYNLPAKPYLLVYELTRNGDTAKNLHVQCLVLAIAAPLVRQGDMYATSHRL